MDSLAGAECRLEIRPFIPLSRKASRPRPPGSPSMQTRTPITEQHAAASPSREPTSEHGTPDTRASWRPPPNWPLLGLHPSQWAAFQSAGYDMRQFWLIKEI